MNVQLILRDGKPEWAILPYEHYQQLIEELEMLEDIRDHDEAIRRIEEGEEMVPVELVYSILDGKHPLRAWREYRGLTQDQLAQLAGFSKSYLTQIESGKCQGRTQVLLGLANALAVDLEDIVDTREA